MRIRFALILNFRIFAHKIACHKIIEDKVPILLMFEVFFTQNSEADYLFCGASSDSEPSLFSTMISLAESEAYSR